MIVLALGVLGLAFGSFVTALTWRLHEKKNFVTGRSQCESCGHRLGGFDLVPFFSWLFLRGRCRYCSKPISWLNPMIELTAAVLFIVSYIFWPLDFATWQAWVSFGIWLVYIVMLTALLVYDFRWMLLPDVLVFPLIALGLVDAGIRLSLQPDFSILNYLQHVALGAGALGGVYWLLYMASKGKWVGFGDVKLGLFMGVVLGWPQALLTLFLANVVGFLVVAPGLASGKLTPKSRVPFGPFLVVAFLAAGLFGQRLVDWYTSLILPA